MNEARLSKTLEVARLVSDIISKNGSKCFVIGASAMAVHGYARQSVDLDLATHVFPHDVLPRLAIQFKELGFATDVVLPDADDPLGGVINVTGSDFETVQIVNFNNPFGYRRIHKLVGTALSELEIKPGELKVVSPELLIVLKLYAGDAQSLSDIHKLLEANPSIDIAKVTELAQEAGLEKEWSAAIS